MGSALVSGAPWRRPHARFRRGGLQAPWGLGRTRALPLLPAGRGQPVGSCLGVRGPFWLRAGGQAGRRVKAGSPARKPCSSSLGCASPSLCPPALGPFSLLVYPINSHRSPAPVPPSMCKGIPTQLDTCVPASHLTPTGSWEANPPPFLTSRRSAFELPGNQSAKGSPLLVLFAQCSRTERSQWEISGEPPPQVWWNHKSHKTFGKFQVTGCTRFL